MSTVKIEWNDTAVKVELRKATQAGSLDAAKHVGRLARSFAPTGNRQYSGAPGGKSWQSRKPGRLRRSIKVYKSKFRGGGAVVVAGSEKAFYSRFVELGTPGNTRRLRSSRSNRKTSTRTPIKANPFMGKALKASKGAVVDIIGKELKKRLRQ